MIAPREDKIIKNVKQRNISFGENRNFILQIALLVKGLINRSDLMCCLFAPREGKKMKYFEEIIRKNRNYSFQNVLISGGGFDIMHPLAWNNLAQKTLISEGMLFLR